MSASPAPQKAQTASESNAARESHSLPPSSGKPMGGPSRKTRRIVVAGQVPPPICGQNLSIASVIGLLKGRKEFVTDHWAFKFSPTWSTVRGFGFRKVLELGKVWGRLIKLRSRGEIDVVLFPVGGPHIAPAIRDIILLPWALAASKRVVLHFRAAGIAGALPKFPKLIAHFLKALYSECDHAIVLSEYGRRDAEAMGIRNIEVIPNGGEDQFDEKLVSKSNANRIIILNVGLLSEDKGTPQLLEAFAKLHLTHPNTVLRLVGEPMGGLTRESILEKVKSLGISDAVELTGVLRDEALHRAFAEADFFVFSSIAPFESFGRVLMEAMMWSLPVVATDWRANSEVLGENHGGALARVDQNLSENLAEAMHQVIERQESWPEMGERNRAHYLKHFEIKTLEARLTSYLQGDVARS